MKDFGATICSSNFPFAGRRGKFLDFFGKNLSASEITYKISKHIAADNEQAAKKKSKCVSRVCSFLCWPHLMRCRVFLCKYLLRFCYSAFLSVV